MAFKMKSGNSPSFKKLGSYGEEEESPNKFLGKLVKKAGKFALGGGLIGAGVRALTGKNNEEGGGDGDCDCEGEGGSGSGEAIEPGMEPKQGVFGGFGAEAWKMGRKALEKYQNQQMDNQIKKEEENR